MNISLSPSGKLVSVTIEGRTTVNGVFLDQVIKVEDHYYRLFYNPEIGIYWLKILPFLISFTKNEFEGSITQLENRDELMLEDGTIINIRTYIAEKYSINKYDRTTISRDEMLKYLDSKFFPNWNIDNSNDIV